MIDDKFIDLLHRQAEGKLTPEETAALQNILDSDNDARAYHDDYLLGVRAMNHISAVDPPPDLKQSVLSALAAKEKKVARRRPILARLSDIFVAPATRRYGLVFSAGAVCGILLLVVSLDFSGSTTEFDLTQVSGTMSIISSIDSISAIDRAEFQFERSRGRLETKRFGGQLFLQLNISSQNEVNIDISFDSAGMFPIGFWGSAPFSGDFIQTEGQLRTRVEGTANILVGFTDRMGTASELRCDIQSDSERCSVVLTAKSTGR